MPVTPLTGPTGRARRDDEPTAGGEDLAHEESYDPQAWLKHPMVQRPAGKHAITLEGLA